MIRAPSASDRVWTIRADPLLTEDDIRPVAGARP